MGLCAIEDPVDGLGPPEIDYFKMGIDEVFVVPFSLYFNSFTTSEVVLSTVASSLRLLFESISNQLLSDI